MLKCYRSDSMIKNMVLGNSTEDRIKYRITKNNIAIILQNSGSLQSLVSFLKKVSLQNV